MSRLKGMSKGIFIVLVILVWCTFLPANALAQPTSPNDAISELREVEDPFNQINTALFKEAQVEEFFADEIPRKAFSFKRFELEKPLVEVKEQPPEKIHPLLKDQLLERFGDETERIVISFRDEVKIPRFPQPRAEESSNSAFNKQAMARAKELIEEIKAQRAQAQEKIAEELESRYSAQVLDNFWLVNAVLVEMPLSSVSALAEREDVLYLEPEQTPYAPPQNANPNDDVDDGRARIVSDPYFNLGLTSGWIGLLDTGMRFTHTQFNTPSHIALRYDCTDGTCNSSPDPTDDCWNHGTSSGGIITANSNQGNPYRGVTAITLDSFKVYPTNPTGCGGLNTTAVLKGFEKAVEVLDRVIVAEMQGSGSDTSAISTAADNAFDAGAVIIAANGNNGPNSGTVNTPANAHRVIGVGNFDVQTGNQIASQSRGPAPDNRFKPDVQAPTNSETASNASDTALRVFGGTSGATPYASGAAALLRNWLRGTSFSIDPGQVYAQLILSGQQPYPFNNTSGAGPLRLPTDGRAWWGKVSVSDGQTIDIPLNISGTAPNTFDGALWWPETASQAHNDIDLYLVAPSGSVRDSSISISSVFERARVGGSVASGTWKLRIRGYNVPTGSQAVYWAAHVRLS